MRNILACFTIIFITFFSSPVLAVETVNFPSQDGLELTADIYMPDEVHEPRTVIIYFHQEGSSRGEYQQIGPRLADMGYIGMAVDLRIGGLFAGVENKTAEKTRQLLVPVPVVQAAYPDMLSSLFFAKQNLNADRLLIWGSSRTATMSLILAAQQRQTIIDGVFAFSAAEHFNFNPPIYQLAENINIPVFMTSGRGEEETWKSIFNALPSDEKMGFVPKGMGKTGSSALTTRHKDEYWRVISRFLEQYFIFDHQKDISVSNTQEQSSDAKKERKFIIYAD